MHGFEFRMCILKLGYHVLDFKVAFWSLRASGPRYLQLEDFYFDAD